MFRYGTLVSSCLALVSFALHAQSVTPRPAVRAVHALPVKKKNNFAIQTELKRLIDNAPAHSKIRASIYTINDDVIVQAFAAAATRKVDVRLILDNTMNGTGNSAYRDALIAGVGSSNVTVCGHGGCIAHQGNNHNKFYAFSESKNPQGQAIYNVAAQTSSNLGGGQYKKAQDMVVFENDLPIYNHYLNYWNAMEHQLSSTNEYAENDYARSTNGTTISPVLESVISSSATQGEDLHVDYLSRAKCKPGEGRIDLVQSAVEGARSAPILVQLKRLQTEGCLVNILIHDDTEAAGLALYLTSGLPVRIISHLDTHFHSKIMLIDAYYPKDGVDKRYWIVFAGSRNLGTKPLRKNDDTTIIVKKRAIYDSYLNFVKDYTAALTAS